MESTSINIRASDKRNTTSTYSLPFRRYEKPRIELIGVENALVEDDGIILFPPESVLRFKITSVVGLDHVVYRIGDAPEQRIQLAGEREYILTIRIS